MLPDPWSHLRPTAFVSRAHRVNALPVIKIVPGIGPDGIGGLPLLEPHQRDPMRATTAGTGELIRAALARQPRRIMLTLGGSATVDGGTGAARALGWQFLDANGQSVPAGGAGRIRARRERCAWRV